MSKIKLRNIYEHIPKVYFNKAPYYNPNACHGVIKHPFMAGVIGGSQTGKTSTAIDVIENCNCFERIEVYTKNKTEVVYKWLADVLGRNPDVFFCSSNLDDLKAPEEYDPKIQTLIIVDDFVLDKKLGNVPAIFQRGMKMNISCLFISQSYHKIPKTDIRDNMNAVILKSINSQKDFKALIGNFNLDKSMKELKTMYDKAIINKPQDFMLIDPLEPNEKLRFRRNFSEIWTDGHWETAPEYKSSVETLAKEPKTKGKKQPKK